MASHRLQNPAQRVRRAQERHRRIAEDPGEGRHHGGDQRERPGEKRDSQPLAVHHLPREVRLEAHFIANAGHSRPQSRLRDSASELSVHHPT
jgi:hypothetical protein